MEVFEVHITGDKSILTTAPLLSLRTIAVALLAPDQTIHRIEYMTSDVLKYRNFEECKEAILYFARSLKRLGTEVIRIKIESPFYPHYADNSLYIESHFDSVDNKFPLSQNLLKDFKLATHREYKRDKYEDFLDKYNGEVVELCLYDTFIEEDADWFSLYNNDNA
jgi:hypothetical protein